MNRFDLDTLADPIEVWPPAPLKAVEQDKAQPAPRPSVWLQLGLGLVAGVLFVPTVWLCMGLIPDQYADLPLALIGIPFLAALTLSALAWWRYKAFAVTFGIIALASFVWFASAMAELRPG